jgi:hypothetical protein
MTKEELIRHCQEAAKTEESANAIYMRHLHAILLHSGLPREKLEEARDSILLLMDGNRRHKRVLERLIERIRREDCDVY